MFPYEKLEVYKKASIANDLIYPIIKNNKSIPGYVKNQLGRAALSILLNIAEGSGRVTDRDRKSFLINSRGSTFECAAIVKFLFDRKEISVVQKNELYLLFDEISRMLFTMIKNIDQKSSNS